LNTTSSKADIDEFFRCISVKEDSFLDQSEKRLSGLLPTFSKSDATHIVYKEVRYHEILPNILRRTNDVRIICLVRNPLAVIHSWLNAPREFRADLGWQPLKEWRYALLKNLNRPEEYNGYERWKEATHLFLHLQHDYPDRLLVVNYRDLLISTEDKVRHIFDYCGLPFLEQTRSFIVSSRTDDNADPYAVYRASACDSAWQGSLDKEIVNAICNDLKGSDLESLL